MFATARGGHGRRSKALREDERSFASQGLRKSPRGGLCGPLQGFIDACIVGVFQSLEHTWTGWKLGVFR
jgi:hypothetical protein